MVEPWVAVERASTSSQSGRTHPCALRRTRVAMRDEILNVSESAQAVYVVQRHRWSSVERAPYRVRGRSGGEQGAFEPAPKDLYSRARKGRAMRRTRDAHSLVKRQQASQRWKGRRAELLAGLLRKVADDKKRHERHRNPLISRWKGG